MKFPMATILNIDTDRKTQGAKPAKNPNDHRPIKIKTNFIKLPFLVFGIGFNIKVKNNRINPTCKPETDNT